MKQEKDRFEELKKDSSNTIMLIAFIFFGAVIFTFVTLMSKNTDHMFFVFFIWIAAIILVGFIVNDYQYKFKETIIKPFVESKGLRYLPRNMIDEVYIKKSKLIRGYDSIGGRDLIQGKGFSFSQVRVVEYEEDDEDHTKITVIFDGVFYRCELPKNINIKGTYFVHKALINLDGLLPPIFSRTRVRLEHREFEHLFNVYGDGQIEGRYIFDHTFMEKLLSIYDKYKFDGISIVNGCLYIVFPNVDLIKVHLSFSGLDSERIELIKNKIFFFASLREHLFYKYLKFEDTVVKGSSFNSAQ